MTFPVLWEKETSFLLKRQSERNDCFRLKRETRDLSSEAVFLEEADTEQKESPDLFGRFLSFSSSLLLSSQTLRKSLSFPVQKYPTGGSIRGVEPIDSIIYLYQERERVTIMRWQKDWTMLLTVHGIPSSWLAFSFLFLWIPVDLKSSFLSCFSTDDKTLGIIAEKKRMDTFLTHS